MLALSKLQQIGFLRSDGPHDESNKQVWRQVMISKSPTFQYSDTVLKTELLGLIFVRAHRERNFLLYVAYIHQQQYQGVNKEEARKRNPKKGGKPKQASKQLV